ncbi:MAG: putative Ig domain-containing protein, partial [Leeuwenhoekiella sp.]
SNGDYVTNEINEQGSGTVHDALHFVGTINDANGTYYGGHPAPIRAFPEKAGILVYKEINDNWVVTRSDKLSNLLNGVRGYFNNSFSVNNFPNDPRQGEHLSGVVGPKVNILYTNRYSSNGICEYTASNFNGLMKGDILNASFNERIYRYKIKANGKDLETVQELFQGFGADPLDVIAQGDYDIFPGTVWAAVYGGSAIKVFEPADMSSNNCPLPGDSAYNPKDDPDGDGYTNEDEIANNTDPCSGGSYPQDNDKDKLSDLLDKDDDNDGLLDVNDPFAIDPNNGLTTNLPINYPFWNNDPGTGFFGLGFTGLMITPSGTTDYLDQYNDSDLAFGGAAGKASIERVDSGDAKNNNQNNAFQFGINVNTSSKPFTVHSKLEAPFFGVNGNATKPVNGQSCGVFIGNGDQNNYLKVVLMEGTVANDNQYGIEVLRENNGTKTSNKFDISGILNANSLEIFIHVEPGTNTAQPYISVDGGANVLKVGQPVALPTNFLSSSDNRGMAVGIISTAGTGPEFTSTWDFINVTESEDKSLVSNVDLLDFAAVSLNSREMSLNLELSNEGGPIDGAITISGLNIVGANSKFFSSDFTLPVDVGPGSYVQIPVIFNPDADTNLGVKTASLEIVHSGVNSPTTIQLRGETIAPTVYTPVVRINAGGAFFKSTDNGPNWEANTSAGATSGVNYSFNTGQIKSESLTYSSRHSSIPNYIDQVTFNNIFAQSRWDSSTSPEMILNIPVTSGTYIARLYMGESDSDKNSAGKRVYNINIEGNPVAQDVDLVASYGYKAASMAEYEVNVIDGELNIQWIHKIGNPLISAIELLSVSLNIHSIDPQVSFVGDHVELNVNASGGDPNKNIVYSISGQPQGVDIEPTNGLISGTISQAATSGGTNGNGEYLVTVTASRQGSNDVSTTFSWKVNPSTIKSLTWTDKNENENYTARHECSFVQAGDKFYLFGGRENAQRFDVYDYKSNTWAQFNNIPKEFNHFQAVQYKGLIWVIGAFKNNDYPRETPADYIWSYNPATQKWIQGPEIPQNRKRGSAGLVVYNNKFYIVGGNTIGHDGGYVNWFDEYDPYTGIWTTLTNAPRSRDHFQAVVIDGKLYAIGGRLSGGTGGVFEPLIAQVDVFDFATMKWTTLPSSKNLPTPRGAPTVVNFQNLIYVIGGEIQKDLNGNTINDALTTTESFDPSKNGGTWKTEANMVYKRHGTQGIVSGDGIHITAGSKAKGGSPQKNMEVFGTDDPVGQVSIAGELSAPLSVEINPDEAKSVIIQNTTGNVGIIIKSLQITGGQAAKFNLVVGGGKTNFLIGPHENYEVIVKYTGTVKGEKSNLLITYNDGSTRQIGLSSIMGAVDNNPPVITNPEYQSSYESETVSLQIIATDGEEDEVDQIMQYSASGLPQSLSINSQSGIISGTINSGTAVNSPYSVKVTVADNGTPAKSSSVDFIWNVNELVGNVAPSAAASSDFETGTVPLTVKFTGSNSSADVVSYKWDFNDGTATSSSSNPTHTFTSVGTYDVTLTVKDKEGLSDVANIKIVVQDNLPLICSEGNKPIADAYLQGTTRKNTGELRVE